MNSISFNLPFPPPSLNPNNKSMWPQRHKASRKYKDQCGWSMIGKGVRRFKAEKLILKAVFHPPDNRRRDDDNMFSSFKYGQDSIAEIIGLDDQHFTYKPERGDPEKGGRVHVTLEAIK